MLSSGKDVPVRLRRFRRDRLSWSQFATESCSWWPRGGGGTCTASTKELTTCSVLGRCGGASAMRSASWQMLLSTDHFLRTRSEHSSNCRRSPCQKFIFDRDKSRFGRTRRPRTVPNARLRGPSQTQRPSRRSHRIASAVRSCPPRTQPALARKARVPDVQRRVLFGLRNILFWNLPGLYVLSHRARHKVHLVLSSRLRALLQIVTLIQHAILVRGSPQLFLPPPTIGAR